MKKIIFSILLLFSFSSYSQNCNKYLVHGNIEKVEDKLKFIMNKGTTNQKIVQIGEKDVSSLTSYIGKKVEMYVYFIDGRKDGILQTVSDIKLVEDQYTQKEDLILSKSSIACGKNKK